MTFRTMLIDPLNTPKDGKVNQTFHPNVEKAAEWATQALANASPQAFVTLYATVEVVVHTYRQPKPALAPAPAPEAEN